MKKSLTALLLVNVMLFTQAMSPERLLENGDSNTQRYGAVEEEQNLLDDRSQGLRRAQSRRSCDRVDFLAGTATTVLAVYSVVVTIMWLTSPEIKSSYNVTLE